MISYCTAFLKFPAPKSSPFKNPNEGSGNGWHQNLFPHDQLVDVNDIYNF
jgi:hypothetical protein